MDKRLSADIALIRADENDAKEIWEMQKIAFADLLLKYQDYDTNPANEPLENVLIRLKQPYTYFYFIQLNEIKIGAIRVVDMSTSQKKRISPLFILPEYRNQGYAQSAIFEVEKIHGESNWELSTILQESANCHLYEKTGYHKSGKLVQINSFMTLVYYEK